MMIIYFWNWFEFCLSFARSLALSLSLITFFPILSFRFVVFDIEFESPFRFVQFFQLIMCIFKIVYHHIDDTNEERMKRRKQKPGNIKSQIDKYKY